MIDIPDSIFPVDDSGAVICPKCRSAVKICKCPVTEPEQKNVAEKPKPSCKIRLETSGRHGKDVTVIEGLTTDPHDLKDLAKTLKTKTGSGGTFYVNDKGGVIEIQGDHRADVQRILRDKLKLF